MRDRTVIIRRGKHVAENWHYPGRLPGTDVLVAHGSQSNGGFAWAGPVRPLQPRARTTGRNRGLRGLLRLSGRGQNSGQSLQGIFRPDRQGGFQGSDRSFWKTATSAPRKWARTVWSRPMPRAGPMTRTPSYPLISAPPPPSTASRATPTWADSSALACCLRPTACLRIRPNFRKYAWHLDSPELQVGQSTHQSLNQGLIFGVRGHVRRTVCPSSRNTGYGRCCRQELFRCRQWRIC